MSNLSAVANCKQSQSSHPPTYTHTHIHIHTLDITTSGTEHRCNDIILMISDKIAAMRWPDGHVRYVMSMNMNGHPSMGKERTALFGRW